MKDCENCIYYTHCDEYPFDESGCDDFKDFTKCVEVVRCKDCKHWTKCESSLIGEVMCCTGQGSVYIQKGADDFCSCGERRDPNAND